MIVLLQAVFTVDHERGLTLIEIADDTTVEDVVEVTGAQFEVSLIITTCR